MKRIIKYLKPYRGKLALAALLVSVSTLCDLLLPTLMSNILNSGVRAGDFPFILRTCLIMLAVAVIVNNFSSNKNRHYPKYWI